MLKIIEDDLNSYYKEKEKSFIEEYLKNPGFKYTFWFRIANRSNNILLKILLRRYQVKFGIQIPVSSQIGSGLTVNHYNCIVINPKSKIGKNLDIRQGCTIGNNAKGTPIIGDNVYLGAGAKIIGNVVIGNNVIVGANAVVTKDVPDNCVVAGIPAKVIKEYNEKISVIILKDDKNFDNCVEAIKQQRYKNLEILCVSNEKVPNFETFNNINSAIENSIGEFIIFIKSERILNIDAIDYMYSYLKRDYCDLFFSSVNEKRKIKYTFSSQKVLEQNLKLDLELKLLNKNLLKGLDIKDIGDQKIAEEVIKKANYISVNTYYSFLKND